jgi:hypothetical protein
MRPLSGVVWLPQLRIRRNVDLVRPEKCDNAHHRLRQRAQGGNGGVSNSWAGAACWRTRCPHLPQGDPCERDLYLSCAKFVTTPEYAPQLRERLSVNDN